MDLKSVKGECAYPPKDVTISRPTFYNHTGTNIQFKIDLISNIRHCRYCKKTGHFLFFFTLKIYKKVKT